MAKPAATAIFPKRQFVALPFLSSLLDLSGWMQGVQQQVALISVTQHATQDIMVPHKRTTVGRVLDGPDVGMLQHGRQCAAGRTAAPLAWPPRHQLACSKACKCPSSGEGTSTSSCATPKVQTYWQLRWLGSTGWTTRSTKMSCRTTGEAFKVGSQCSSESLRNKALEAFKKHLVEKRALIEEANAQDKAEAEVAVKAGKLSSSLFKRLDVSGTKFDTLLKGIDEIFSLPDPIGQVTYANKVAEGLDLYRLTCPIGVLLIIFEARPDAAVQIASLAMKSGNALLLKGGKEAQRSNAALVTAMSAALQDVGLPADCIQGVDTRTEVAELLKQDKYIDLVIPRGSNELVRSIKDASRIPVLGHADGICAVYVDSKADLDKAVKIVVDSKTQYCAACNSMETLLVHEDVCTSFLPKLAAALEGKDDVHYKADATCLPHLPAAISEPVQEDDFDTEFLCHTMAVKAVASVQEAVDHINSHSSGHTESIVTEDPMIAETFLSRIDSAGVYHNCSTRFADGFRYGFGAEVGISTNRIHARGPSFPPGEACRHFETSDASELLCQLEGFSSCSRKVAAAGTAARAFCLQRLAAHCFLVTSQTEILR
ncbi:proA, partial [Symbiodinium necroappetens]